MPTTKPATLLEPAPKPTTNTPVWPRVIRELEGYLPGAPAWLLSRLKREMETRDAAGREKDGVALQPFNGRNAGVDAYQEVLDLCAYARQKCDEMRASPWYTILAQTVELVASVAYQLSLKEEVGR